MEFLSTRGGEQVNAAEAIVRGIAKDGGLFVPASFPEVTREEMESMLGMDYSERATLILKKYFDEFDENALSQAVRTAYSRFPDGDPAPLVRVDDGIYVLELFHGPTCAFKDVALCLFPYLMKEACSVCGVKEKVLVLTATSGDTGKAALEGFKDVAGVKIQVFYPDEGVSPMQRQLMCTQEGDNVCVVAVKGNFDDCQREVKNIFTSPERCNALKKKGYILSSANSINIGRLLPQVAYYFSAYCDLVSSEQIEMGAEADFTVPTGNFGNILSAYYAKRMGLPVGRLLCASNKNNVLTDFIRTGVYDSSRPFHRTMSPSMDILVSSNLERYIFELSGRNSRLTAERMESLKETGKYSVSQEELKAMRSEFSAGFTGEDDTVECVYDYFSEYGYAMDTHTGVAFSVARRYLDKRDPLAPEHPMTVVSTASPYKFPQDVLYALSGNDVKDSYKCVKRINLLTAMKVPDAIKEARYKPILFKTCVTPQKMFDETLKFIEK